MCKWIKFLLCVSLIALLAAASGCGKQTVTPEPGGGDGNQKQDVATSKEPGSKPPANSSQVNLDQVQSSPELKQLAGDIAPQMGELEQIINSMDTDYRAYRQGKLTRQELADKYLTANTGLQDLSETFKNAENKLPPDQKTNPLFQNGLSYAHDISLNSALFVTKVVTGDPRVPLESIAKAPALSDEKLDASFNKFTEKKALLPALKQSIDRVQRGS